eukprot:31322-Pelagococcus_subviridis.AAC.3
MDARSEPSHRAESGAGEAADHADPRPTRHGQDAHHPLVALRHLARGSRRQERPRARTAAVPGRSQQEKAADARGDERDDTPRDAVAERRRESPRRAAAAARRAAAAEDADGGSRDRRRRREQTHQGSRLRALELRPGRDRAAHHAERAVWPGRRPVLAHARARRRELAPQRRVRRVRIYVGPRTTALARWNAVP